MKTWIRAAVLIFTSLGLVEIPPSANQTKTKDEELGERLANAIMGSAQAYANAGRRNWVDCDPLDDTMPEPLKPVSQAEHDAAEVMLQIMRFNDERGSINPESSTSAESTCFRILVEEGLASKSAIARLIVLVRIFDLCDFPDGLTRAGEAHCEAVVERACLQTLQTDQDGLNRQVALEILGMEYGSEASIPTLKAIAGGVKKTTGKCMRVFEQRPSDSPDAEGPDLDGIARAYGKGPSPCEGQLAREALARIGKSKK